MHYMSRTTGTTELIRRGADALIEDHYCAYTCPQARPHTTHALGYPNSACSAAGSEHQCGAVPVHFPPPLSSSEPPTHVAKVVVNDEVAETVPAVPPMVLETEKS